VIFAELKEAIGLIAASCTTLSFVPQAWQIIRSRQTAGISLVMYSIFAVGILLWLVYGLALKSPSIIAANAVTFVLVCIILYCKIRFG
jgi:MtN3 and saliva related transmembrane protein